MTPEPNKDLISQWAFDVDIRLERALAERDHAAVRIEHYKRKLQAWDRDIAELKARSAELHGQLKETEK